MMSAKLIEWANQINAINAAQKPKEIAANFVPPYTSVHVGTIKGGTAGNITAKDCFLSLDFRIVPGDDAADWKAQFDAKIAEIRAEMQAIVPSTDIVVTPYFGIPGLVPETEGSAEHLARMLTGDNGTHVVSYGTEAGQFQERGYSAVVCGPGDIAQAHQPNEFISVDQFDKGWAFMERLVAQLAK
jgi:acetylornithine deacetylase